MLVRAVRVACWGLLNEHAQTFLFYAHCYITVSLPFHCILLTHLLIYLYLCTPLSILFSISIRYDTKYETNKACPRQHEMNWMFQTVLHLHRLDVVYLNSSLHR
jgi:hypothetical protein